jgi:hypothetical protein
MSSRAIQKTTKQTHDNPRIDRVMYLMSYMRSCIQFGPVRFAKAISDVRKSEPFKTLTKEEQAAILGYGYGRLDALLGGDEAFVSAQAVDAVADREDRRSRAAALLDDVSGPKAVQPKPAAPDWSTVQEREF